MILFRNQIQKKLVLALAGISFFCFTQACKQNKDQNSPNDVVKMDTIKVSELEVVISTESEELGRPTYIVTMSDGKFAIYDQGLNRVMIFNALGEKLNEFGRTGKGPGEWDTMYGAGDFNFADSKFLMNNRGQYKLDLYDYEGNYLNSVPYPQYWNYSHKLLLNDHQLLITTDGRNETLSAILDLNDEGTIIKKIGKPDVPYSEQPNFEHQRISFSNGEIPDEAKNKALAAKAKNGYLLLMNTFGELRYYSTEGELLNKQLLPEVIREPIINYVVEANKTARPNSVYSLKFVQEMQVKDNFIYLLTSDFGPDADNIDSHFLTYNLQGELINHSVFINEENASALYDFFIDEENQLHFLDVMNAQVLRKSFER